MHYLDLFTDSTFCTNFIDNIKNDYDLFYPAIQAEYPNYRFDLNVLFEKSKMLRENKSALEKLWSETIAKASTNEYWIDERSYSSTSKPIYVKNLELNTYSSGDSINGYSVRLENFHSNELTVISIYNHTQKQTFKNTKISGYTDKFAYVNLNLTFKPDSIQYTLENIPNKIFSQKINSDPKPEGETTRMRIAKKWNPEKFQIQDDIISMSGTIIIDELILIPSNYQVNILPGTHINFIRGGGLIINSKVTALGAKDNPISITSLDSSSNGFTVINGTEFIMENASISGLNSLSYENWSLTGALCIYQTPCTLKNVTISHNFCEDALNIIRSHFEIENLSISHTFSDGFDADFCTGNFSNSSFSNTGNDCIDFSGSKVKIENIKITDSGDKGISAGEASELYLTNIYINGALSGIASKDGSKVFGDSISIKNTGVGLTAFQKKIDYSPATIKLNNCTISSTNKNVEVEKRSELFWNGILYTGTETLDIDAMYSIFDKK